MNSSHHVMNAKMETIFYEEPTEQYHTRLEKQLTKFARKENFFNRGDIREFTFKQSKNRSFGTFHFLPNPE